MRVAGRLLGQRRQFPEAPSCAVVCFHSCGFLHFLCRRPSGAPESPAPEQWAGSPGGLPSLPAPSGGQSRLLPPAPPLLVALAAFRQGWQGVRPPPTHPPVCVCARGCACGLPTSSPPRRALTWVPICCEGHPVAPLLGSCDPGSSVSAASVAFPRKGGWAEATSSALLSPRAARSGGWSLGGSSRLVLVRLSCRPLPVRSVLSILEAL